jgi:hypothetical protein
MRNWSLHLKLGAVCPIAVIVASLFIALAISPALADPFEALRGSWSGTGTIALSSGAKERIRCRAQYRVSASGTDLQLELNCESDSYKFNLQSQLVYRDGDVSGNWSETTRATGGSIIGRAVGNQIQIRADGPTFTAILSVTTRGTRQSISIQSPGSEMFSAAITLALKSL